MIYASYLKDFQKNPELQTREFLLDTPKEALNCYTSIRTFLKRHQLPYTVYYSRSKCSVLISKQQAEEALEMEVHDNVDAASYAKHRIYYGSKYAKIFTEFYSNPDIQNREIPCKTSSKLQSCGQSMRSLIQKYEAEEKVRLIIDAHKRTVFLQKT